MFKRIFLFLYLLTCFCQQASSQNFEWLRSFGSRSGFDIQDVLPEPRGRSIIHFRTHTNFINDTLEFDTFRIISKPGNTLEGLLKLDSNGKVIIFKKTGDYAYSKICKDKDGNLYLIGGLLTGISNFMETKLNSKNGLLFFAKFDKDLNLVWINQTGNRSNTGVQRIFYSGNKIYFICHTRGDTTIIGNKTYYKNSKTDFQYIFGELNKNNGNIVWSESYDNGNIYGDGHIITGIQSLKGNLFISGHFNYYPSSKSRFTIGKDTIKEGGFIIKTDTSGKYIKHINFQYDSAAFNNGRIYIEGIASDEQNLYMVGTFSDSIKWGYKKVGPCHRSNSQDAEREIYVASLNYDLQPRWFYRPEIISRTITNSGNNNSEIICNNGYVYVGTWNFGMKLLFDSTVVNNNKDHEFLILKTDFLGNVLWAAGGEGPNKNSFSAIRSIGVFGGESVFVSGTYRESITLGPYKISSNSGNSFYNGWVTKITDYTISRGAVKSGPYCAGDNILIPYIKFGNFDKTNTFIAQLSNAEGGFENGFVELGRLKTNRDSIIKGVLPLSKVSSSGNYRIRILSTKPAVQSYYLRDSLQLLIYSRDKADPGPAEIICTGDSIRLNTYGGTKWKWSPTYNIDNALKRQPVVWPRVSTNYKIIIADSSGCGGPDTAYKLIIVRPYPRAILAFADTLICNHSRLDIPVQFKGGDSLGYNYQWYFVNGAKWFPLNKGKFKKGDTLNYSPTEPSEKLAIVLNDNCTSRQDTAFLTIRQRTSVNLQSVLKDTLVCNGTKMKWLSIVTGGISKYYQWQWTDLVNNVPLSDKDSLSLIAKQTKRIQLTVSDDCISDGDTQQFILYVNPPLKAEIFSNKIILNDTTLCFGESLKLYSTGKGGTGAGYQFSWILNNDLIWSGDTLMLNTKDHFFDKGGTKQLKLVLNDNCTNGFDSISKTIYVIPSPKADFSFGIACDLSNTPFSFTGTKPLSPIITVFHWDFNGEGTSDLDEPLVLLSNGKKKIHLGMSSNNGCKDKIMKEVVVKPQAKADFAIKDVCETDSAVFINNSEVSKGNLNFIWRFGDGEYSTRISVKHLYSIGGITKTFNVKLTAIVEDGCRDSITKAVTVNASPQSDFTYTINSSKLDVKASQPGNQKYRWLFGKTDSAITNTGQYSRTVTQPEHYNVCLKVTDLNGCISETCKTVSLGMTNLDMLKCMIVYPNPNTGRFTLQVYDRANDLSISFYNNLGEKIRSVHVLENELIYSIDLGKPAQGIYLLSVRNGGFMIYQKIIIK